MLDDRTFDHPAYAPAGSILGRALRHPDSLAAAAAALILLAGAGVVLSSLSARIAQLEAAARATAPIAVIDYAPVLEGLSAGAPREALEAAFAGVKALAEARVAEGYVVINASFVEGAPERVRLTAPAEAQRDLRAAIAAARTLASGEGLLSGLGAPYLQQPFPAPAAPAAPPPAGLGAAMTPEEARALIASPRFGAGREGLR